MALHTILATIKSDWFGDTACLQITLKCMLFYEDSHMVIMALVTQETFRAWLAVAGIACVLYLLTKVHIHSLALLLH